MEYEGLKSDILSSLKDDISTIIRSELTSPLAEDFDSLKYKLREVKTEIANNTAAVRSEINNVKSGTSDLKEGLSSWSDKVVSLQETAAGLQTELASLKEKNGDMESRMRRCNIRIVAVVEDAGSSSTSSVSTLLKDVLQLDKEILVDRSHRDLAPRRSNGKPQVMITKLHYYQECVNVLRQARERGQLQYKGNPVAIFPDYTASIAKAGSTFNDVRNLL